MENDNSNKMKQALIRIRNARDYRAEHGEYPQSPDGPGKGQCFDDWAADVADSACKAEGGAA